MHGYFFHAGAVQRSQWNCSWKSFCLEKLCSFRAAIERRNKSKWRMYFCFWTRIFLLLQIQIMWFQYDVGKCELFLERSLPLQLSPKIEWMDILFSWIEKPCWCTSLQWTFQRCIHGDITTEIRFHQFWAFVKRTNEIWIKFSTHSI